MKYSSRYGELYVMWVDGLSLRCDNGAKRNEQVCGFEENDRVMMLMVH